jgi:chaperone BCS1
LAGIFGLDIFCISLFEPTLTESDLNRLFNNLTHRCIILLEDIDTAGLVRDKKSDKNEGSNKDNAKFNMNDFAKAITTVNSKDQQDEIK